MSFEIDPAAQVGHVNLKVSDLERSIAFYSDILGLKLHQRIGKGGAFLGAGRYHHHVGLNTVRRRGGSRNHVHPPHSRTLTRMSFFMACSQGIEPPSWYRPTVWH